MALINATNIGKSWSKIYAQCPVSTRAMYGYYCYNCLRFRAEVAKEFWSSPRYTITGYAWNLDTNKWEQLFSRYLDGVNENDLEFNTHCRAGSAPYYYTDDSTNHVHYKIAYSWSTGHADYAGIHIWVAPSGLDNQYGTNYYIRGKKNGGAKGGADIWTSSNYSGNPLDYDWGNLTYARGSSIVSSDPYRIISTYRK